MALLRRGLSGTSSSKNQQIAQKSADDVKMALFLIISDKLSLRGGSLQGLDFVCRGAKLRSLSSRHIGSSIRAETGHFSTELSSTVTEQLFKTEYPYVEADRADKAERAEKTRLKFSLRQL